MEVYVPVDIMEEEKSILAIFSMRQFGWVAPFVVLFMVTVIWGDTPFVHGLADFIIRTAFTFLLLGISVALAFLKISSQDCYLDRFILNWFKYKKSVKEYVNM